MPKVSLSPQNQCTLDDPTDGADLPTAMPSAGSSSAAPSAPQIPPCLAREPGAGGATSECTDDIVRNFGSGAGVAPLVQPPVAKERSCGLELFAVASNCGKVALEVAAMLAKAEAPELPAKPLDSFDALNCAISVGALAKCEFGD
jgi:hypothetical protein